MGLCVSTNPSIFGRRAAGVNVGRRKGLKKKKKLGWKLQQNNCLSPSKEKIVEHIR